MDNNGYNESILQEDMTKCFACGRSDRKLDRHEVFGGPFRQKSKAYGLWIVLCHVPCHLGRDGWQYEPSKARGLKAFAEMKAMEHYGWSEDEFRQRFGKSYLHSDFDWRSYGKSYTEREDP